MNKRRIIIMGAAGRDFHNFNTFYRNDSTYQVVGFTSAAQLPLSERVYPRELAGELYPTGIPIYLESDLASLIQKENVDEVVFAYSDVSHLYIMHKASEVLALGADFKLMGTKTTMLKAKVPVVSICAVRTGCGKSQTTRKVSEIIKRMGKRIVVVRHPMPYGDLSKQKVQRFATMADLENASCTIEEREEYEPHIRGGSVVYAGVDYGAILESAEKECDVMIWDGGNNDFPFYTPTLEIVVTDPHRVGHETTYYPGETNLRRADVIVINKVDTANGEDVSTLIRTIYAHNPSVQVVLGASPIFPEDPSLITGKRVLVIEDGPTLTHGEMAYGAGVVAAKRFGASHLVDPRTSAVGSIRKVFESYPHIGPLLPAMGYSKEQLNNLEATINAVDCDLVLIATPVDLRKLINIKKPATMLTYELQEIGKPTLEEIIAKVL